MDINLHILKAGGRLVPLEKTITSIVEEMTHAVNEKFVLPAIDIVIDDDASRTIPETGSGGSAYTAHILQIHINPDFPDIENKLAPELKSTLAHELHHCARWAAVGYGDTLLEAVVSEGLADHFDIEMNGGEPKPWDTAVAGEALAELRKRAESEFANNHYDHRAWFFGSEEQNLPRWGAYSLGFHIVEEHMEKTDKTAAELVGETASQLVSKQKARVRFSPSAPQKY